MATKGFVLYLLTAFSVAVFSGFFFVNNLQNASNKGLPSLLSSSNAGSFGRDNGSDEKVWPVRFFSSLSQLVLHVNSHSHVGRDGVFLGYSQA